MSTEIMLESYFASLGNPRRGKVRDVYTLGDELLLLKRVGC